MNHVIEKVVSSTGGTVVYNTNISVGAVVEAAEIPWKLRKLSRKAFVEAFVEAAERPNFRGSCRLLPWN